jgi:superfamily II DNA or RNA helicase
VEPRPHQARGEAHILEAYNEGVRSQLVVMPTGTGKTFYFSRAPKWFPQKKTIVLAHTEELVDQARAAIEGANPGLRVGVEMADRLSSPTDNVVVGSVPTLGLEGSQRIAKFNPRDYGVIAVDEAHHGVGTSYKRVFSHFGFGVGLDPENRLLLGVTATDKRGDERGLGETFQKVTFRYTMLEAIKDGWIVPPRGYRVRTGTSIDDVHALAGDLNQAELSTAVNTPNRNKLVVQQWLRLGENRQTIGFTVDIAHAVALAAEFRLAGVKAEAVWGTDPERADKLRRHQERTTTVLLNCGVLIEGYDDWQIGCVLLCAPTTSNLRYIQWIGRGTRLQKLEKKYRHLSLHQMIEAGLPIEKTDCLILDFQDSTIKHKLVTLASIFGLPAGLALENKNLVDVVEEMEELEKSNPKVDFSTLVDIDEADSYVEQVNLFADDVDPVIAELSDWRWVMNAKGDYMLGLTSGDLVTLFQNVLGHWEVRGKCSGIEFEDSNRELSASVYTAESLVKRLWKGRASTLKRTPPMPGATIPASAQQIARINDIARLLSKPVPDTRGMSFFDAQLLINSMNR